MSTSENATNRTRVHITPLRLMAAIAISFGIMGMGSGTAFAGTMPILSQTFDLTLSNVFPDGPTYGTVQLQIVNGNQIQITVTAANGYYFGDKFGFNLNPSTGGSVSVVSKPQGSSFKANGSASLGEFGKFDYVFSGLGKYPDRVTGFTFVLAGSLPQGFVSVSDLIGLSDNGAAYFATHIYNSNGTVTGWTGGVSVDEPGMLVLVLMGIGMLCLFWVVSVSRVPKAR